jgi:exonuclease SbcD
MLPFVKPAHVKRFYPEEKIESYTDAIQVAIAHMKIDINDRNVLLTHQFVTGATTCESEEIHVGGSDNVDAAVFTDFDYVALGHIHGPQNIGSNRIRYCGTPLKYSFSEATHYKSVTVIEMAEKGNLQLRTIPLVPRRDMREIRGTFAELTDKAYYGATATDDYLHVILTDEDDVSEALGRLRVIYPNILKLTYDNTRTRTNQIIDGAKDVKRKSPMELFEELYELQNNQPMSEEQRNFAKELIESIWEGNA